MVRRYNSFLVRCWIFDGDTWRIKIEHVQSGDRIQVALPEEAIAWIRAYCEKPPTPPQREKPPSAMAHGDRDDSHS
jgi:hypothetical protein